MLKGRIQRYIFTGGYLKDPHKSLTYIFIPLNTIKFSKSNLIFSVLLFSLSATGGWTAGAASGRQRVRPVGGNGNGGYLRHSMAGGGPPWAGVRGGGGRRADLAPPDVKSGGCSMGGWIRRHLTTGAAAVAGRSTASDLGSSRGGRRIHRLRPRLARVSVFQFWEFYFFLEFYFTCSSHKHQYKKFDIRMRCASRIKKSLFSYTFSGKWLSQPHKKIGFVVVWKNVF